MFFKHLEFYEQTILDLLDNKISLQEAMIKTMLSQQDLKYLITDLLKKSFPKQCELVFNIQKLKNMTLDTNKQLNRSILDLPVMRAIYKEIKRSQK